MRKFGSRLDRVGGRRRAPRGSLLLSASLETIADYHQVELINISSTGAKVRGKDLPDHGSDVLLKAGSVEAFSTVVWASGNLRGLHFDEPVDALLLKQLRRGGSNFGTRPTYVGGTDRARRLGQRSRKVVITAVYQGWQSLIEVAPAHVELSVSGLQGIHARKNE